MELFDLVYEKEPVDRAFLEAVIDSVVLPVLGHRRS